MAQATIKGRASAAGMGDPTDLTPDQVSTILDTATDPFARSSALGAAGITALTGDVTASGSGSVAATVANDAVTYAKMQNVSAASRLLGRGSASGSGDPEEITLGTGLSMSGTTLNGSSAVDEVSIGSSDPGGTYDLWYDTGAASVTPTARVGTLSIEIDGNGAVITTGIKGFLRVDFDCTITKATILSTDAASTAGSIVIDVWKDTYANYPPTVADTITASAKPTLSSANKSEDSTLTGWTTGISAGDVLGFKVDSATTVTRVILELTVRI